VVGVGFLGGGALMRSSKNIHGMTTAATAITRVVLAVLPAIEQYAERALGSSRRPATIAITMSVLQN
jgi:hypothetical protein